MLSHAVPCIPRALQDPTRSLAVCGDDLVCVVLPWASVCINTWGAVVSLGMATRWTGEGWAGDGSWGLHAPLRLAP